jgi:hypothetical protein
VLFVYTQLNIATTLFLQVQEGEMNRLKSLIRLESIFVAIMLTIMILILFRDGISGVADNGDFYRAFPPNQLMYEQDKSYDELFFKYVNYKYSILDPSPMIKNEFLNTHVFTIYLAKIANVFIHSSEKFDIRFVSFIYILLFLIGMYILMKNLKTKILWIDILIFTLMTLVFVDSSNILYFNSLFAEPNAYVFFILSLAFFSSITKKESPKVIYGVLFFLCTAIF